MDFDSEISIENFLYVSRLKNLTLIMDSFTRNMSFRLEIAAKRYNKKRFVLSNLFRSWFS